MGAGRRQFLTGLGFAAAGAAMASPAIADPAPDVEWRLTSSFVSSLDLIYGGKETSARPYSTSPTAISRSRSPRPGRSRARGVGSRSRRQGRMRAYRAGLLLGQGSELRIRLLDAVRHERAATRSLAHRRGRRRPDRRIPGRPQGFCAAGGRYRGPDGGLVPQGNPHPARSERPEGADRRLRRRDPDAGRRAG